MKRKRETAILCFCLSFVWVTIVNKYPTKFNYGWLIYFPSKTIEFFLLNNKASYIQKLINFILLIV